MFCSRVGSLAQAKTQTPSEKFLGFGFRSSRAVVEDVCLLASTRVRGSYHQGLSEFSELCLERIYDS